MLRATPTIQKMASTHGGMRRILKKRLPVDRYIELAVKSGSYKTPSTRPGYLGHHDIDQEPKGRLSPREREQRLKLRRGIIDYPPEYEILSLNPPLPTPPRTPVRVRKQIISNKRKHLAKLKKERKKAGLPEDDDSLPKVVPNMDRLVKSYLRRHDDNMRAGMSPSQSKREEEYYSNLLLGPNSSANGSEDEKFMSASSLQTVMGRKSRLVENAYAFALRQQQVMLRGDVSDDDGKEGESKVITEDDSVEKVEHLLREEARANRQMGRKTVEDLDEWRTSQTDESTDDDSKKDDKDSVTDSLPSILHSKPRAIRALSIWSSRLNSIPYSKWTIGASTALDHWIAREVLQMEESTWQQVLEGGGTDVYASGATLPGGESKRGLMDRMRDIVLVRGALFPETFTDGPGAGDAASDGLQGDLDDGLLSAGDDASATEKSIDALLASLGEFDDDDEFKFDDDEEEKKVEEGEAESDVDADRKLTLIMDELQVWRERNASSPYEAWDADRKNEFDQWIESYVSALYPEADAGSVDKEATRISLLSKRPVDAEKTKEFWTRVRNESEAEVFLRDYRDSVKEQLDTLGASSALTKEDKVTQSELEAILSVSFEDQLAKFVDMGTLRPILDDYASGSERQSFFAKYAHIFLEGLEMEHLVPDPDGPIGLDDVSSEIRAELSAELSQQDGNDNIGDTGKAPRFSIRMVAYGTDEYGTSRSERARELYRLWNEHKANRARFEEALFKRGYLGVEEDGVARVKRRKNKNKDGKKK